MLSKGYYLIFVINIMSLSKGMDGYTDKELVRCETFDDCRAACGPSASHYKCHTMGYCSCLNSIGYPIKCQDLNKFDLICNKMCQSGQQQRIPKRCNTDAGLFCTCFQNPNSNVLQIKPSKP